MDKLAGTTKDIIAENISELKQLFPTAFSENKVDFDTLKQLLGDYIENDNERYSFNWHGKTDARIIAQTQSTGTLRPCKDESVDWNNSKNLFIEGDNLEVLKLLQKSYHKKVKMIYIDPPYNTGKDFVYKDNFKDNIKNYKEMTGQTDGDGRNLSSNPETSGRYHTDWLNMMYPRLLLARGLLCDDGVIFISIDDNEVANLRKICDEIFGEENFVAEFPRITKRAGKSSESFAKNNDTLLSYQKNNHMNFNTYSHSDEGFKYVDEYLKTRGKYKLNQTLDYGSIQYSPSLDYNIYIEGHVLRPGNVSENEMIERKKRNPKTDYCWRWSQDLYQFGLKSGFIVLKKSKEGYRIYTKTYENVSIEKINNIYKIVEKNRTNPISSIRFIENKYSNDNSRKDIGKLFNTKVFEYSKPVSLIKECSFIGSNKSDIILDFFAGSATTAHAVIQLNAEDNGKRKYIMVQLPEACDKKSEAYKAGYKNIAEIGKERIRRAANKIQTENPDYQGDLGFKVFKLDSTNIKPWDVEFDINEQDLFDRIDNIKPERSTEDILYEILLKYGLDLTLTIEEHNILGSKLFNIGSGALIICLEKNISLELVEEIVKLKAKHQPETMRVVFQDSCFADCVIKTNAVQILQQAGITDVKSL